MDSLLVDLDKVLDDFEAEEDEAPGNERKPSGFHEFLEKSNEQTFKVIDSYIPASNITQNDHNSLSQTTENIENICYDFPYEPENFDISEADFAPSPSLGDSGYNGSLSYAKYDSQTLTKSLVKGNSVENQNENGIERSECQLQNTNITSNNIMSNDSSVIKNDLQPGKFKLNFPVQADNSPNSDHVYPSGEMNGYGNLQWSNPLLPKQNNSDNYSEQSPSRQASVQSFTSTDSKSDPDKYPVQCNTPQTPKENMFVNPLDSQISSMNSVQSSGALSNSSHDSMQEKEVEDQKLAHLKKEMTGSLTEGNISGETNKDTNVLMNASNSLPASFYAKLDNDDETHSSLPLNLSNGVHKASIINKNVECYNGHTADINVSADQNTGVVSDYIKPGWVDSKQSELVEGEQTVVGFGEVDDDTEESHMDDYLQDVDMNVNKAVTNTMAYTINNDDFTAGHGDETSSPMVGTENGKLNEVMDGNYKQGYQPFNSAEGDFSTVTNKPNVDDLSVKSNHRAPGETHTGFNQLTHPSNGVIQALPVELNSATSTVTTYNPVITNPDTNLSPLGLISIDSGLASLNDNVTDSGSFPSPITDITVDGGARPKDTSSRMNRPEGLLQGVSAVNLDADSPFVLKPSPTLEEYSRSDDSPTFQNMVHNEIIQNELKQRMDTGDPVTLNTETVETMDTSVDPESNTENSSVNAIDSDNVNIEDVEMRRPVNSQGGAGSVTSGRPRSWSPADSGQPPVQKQKRPTSLNLPPLPQINLNERSPREEDGTLEDIVGAESGESGDAVTDASYTGTREDLDNSSLEGAVGGEEIPYIPPEHPGELEPPPSYSSMLGKVAPKWIPDAEAPACMNCHTRFTFTKRRHHCRACGKVFCSACCNMKARLEHLKNQEARVCMQCYRQLSHGDRTQGESGSQTGFNTNQPGPGDYGDMGGAPGASSGPPPPSVLVPVLKRDGNGIGSPRDEGTSTNRRSEPKQVMFSDGIRPGGDLTELDGRSEITRLPPRRTRVQKRVERVSSGGQHSSRSRHVRTTAERTFESFIPAEGLPPLLVPKEDGIGFDLQKNPDPVDFMAKIKDEQSPPVIFAINSNLHVLVKIINLDCCVNRVVWCITTKGMTSVGQEEIVTILETIPDETTVPRDIFTHVNAIFEDASKGNPVTELGHTIFNQCFLDSRDHGGFLYIRSTFQCTQKLILPSPPFLFGILLQKWETPWAKVFPIRLLLRLGAEYRYYPCPLIGVRNRKPVFFEIGHTIMNLLADFRNFQYMLPSIKGITIHMEDKVTKINFPRNTYEDLMKVVNNSNEHVMAVAANFSPDADSHLVCIQNDDGNYQTQAINIQNKPRKVTGASFVVFNGALKTSSGLTAKSSIVEDGLMVQITPDSMLALKQSMKDMREYTITCAVIGAPKPDETVIVQWIDDDKNINIGVKSPIDGMSMDGIESLRIQNSIDYISERYCIRWTEIFFIQNRDGGSLKWEPVDLSRLGETLATAFCVALTPHLQSLKESDLTKIGLRVTLGVDNVGYEAGAGGQRLPDVYMNDLDNELIPVIHRATQADGSMVLEMIFQVLD